MTTATKTKERNRVGKITDEERNAKLAELVSRQTRYWREWQDAIEARVVATANEKSTKEAYHDACKESQNILRDPEGGLPLEGEDEQKPQFELPDTFDEKALRATPLEDLGLKKKTCRCLIEPDEKSGKPVCAIVGDIEDWLKADPGNRIANISGLGEAAEREFAERLKAHVAEYEGTEAA